MPGRPRRSRREKKADKVRNPNRTRAIAAVVIVVLLVLVLSMRAFATFWTDYLWFDTLGRSSVWRALLGSKVTLGAATTLVFFVLLYANLIIADRLAPRFVPSGGAEEEMLERYREFITGRQRLVFFVVSLVVAIVPGFSASASGRTGCCSATEARSASTTPSSARTSGSSSSSSRSCPRSWTGRSGS